MKKELSKKIIVFIILLAMLLGLIGIPSESTYAETEDVQTGETYADGNENASPEAVNDAPGDDLSAEDQASQENPGGADNTEGLPGDNSEAVDSGSADGSGQQQGSDTEGSPAAPSNEDQQGSDGGTGSGTGQDGGNSTGDDGGNNTETDPEQGADNGTGTGSGQTQVSQGEQGGQQDPEDPAKENSKEGQTTEEQNTSEEAVQKAAKDETEETQTPPAENAERSGWPAFSQKVKVGKVTVEVRAPEKAFPADASLKVSKITSKDSVQSDISSAVETQRDEKSSNVAASYTFDIKIVDKKGTELQPADGLPVQVFFTAQEVADKNLDTQIYHIEEKEGEFTAEALDVSVSEKTASVSTGGFSYYTVEFTYGDMQYVLEGGSVVKLSELLGEIGIEGNVTGITVSNSDLFDVILGTDEGVRTIMRFSDGETVRLPANNPKGTIRYVVSLQPFDTEEWMDVIVDGQTYHIVVTDAITDSGLNTGNIPGVVQGTFTDFTATMPLSDIWIDETKLNSSEESRNLATWIPGSLMKEPGFVCYDTKTGIGTYTDEDGHERTKNYGRTNGIGHAKYKANQFIEYDTSLPGAVLDGKEATTRTSDGVTVYQSVNQFTGVIGTYKWENAAVRLGADGSVELLDVYIEYSDPMITFEHPADGSVPLPINDMVLGLFSGNMITVGASKPDFSSATTFTRSGLTMTVKPYVLDKNYNPVQGYFYYPMLDIDVNRLDIIGNESLYKANKNLANYDYTTRSYSEMASIESGIYTNSRGETIYIPGSPEDSMMYKSNILYDDGKYVVCPGTGNNASDKNTFYSGFVLLAQNGTFQFGFTGSSNTAGSGMENYVLSGQSFNHKLRHSTTDGGTIRTTYEGNYNGKLNDGSRLIEPQIIATATGQTVVYTFIPEEGYSLNGVYVKSGPYSTEWDPDNIPDDYKIKEGDGTNGTYKSWDDDGDGKIDRYTYTFSGINSDNAIHVSWEKTVLDISKKVEGNDVVDDTFTFRIRAYKNENGTVTYVDFNDKEGFTASDENWYTFSLKAYENVSIEENTIPVGYRWEVQEVKTNGEYGTQGNWRCARPEFSGEITQANQVQQANFVNTRMKNTPADRRILVKKEWQGDNEDLRPDKLTIHARAGGMAVFANGPAMRTYMENLAGGNVLNITAFRTGTKEDCESAIAEGKAVPISNDGEAPFVYLWYTEGTVYYYSDNDVYLGTDASKMFSDFTNLTDISGLAGIHTDYVEDFSEMFKNCYQLSDLEPLSNWNTANAKNMYRMFGSGKVSPTPSLHNPMAYTDLTPLSNWNVKRVENMNGMFRGGSMTSVEPIKDWKTYNLKDMGDMFFRTLVEDGAVLSGWDASHIVNNTIIHGFSNVFRYSTSNSYTPYTVPNFINRPGTWNNTGTYTPMDLPTEVPGDRVTDYTLMPNTSEAGTVLSETYYSKQQDGSWLFEIEVPEGKENLEWSIYEDIPSSYKIIGKGSAEDPVTGVKTGNEDEPVVLTNRIITRTLTVGKRVDEVLDDDEEFSFEIKFWTGEVKYQNPYDLESKPEALKKTGEGTYLLKLKTRGLSPVEQEIPGIAYGVKYEVRELHKDGWRLVLSPNAFGIMNEDKTASFLNTKNSNGIVVKYWEDHNNRFHTRPKNRDAVIIKATIRKYNWIQDDGTVITVTNSDPEYSVFEEAYNDESAKALSELEKNIYDIYGSKLSPTAPRYITYNDTQYVCDKNEDGSFTYYKVEEEFTDRVVSSSDSGVTFEADDVLNTWYYEFTMSEDERIIEADEIGEDIPFYDKGKPTVDETGMVGSITNTIKTHDLTVTKTVSDPVDDRSTTFDFAVKFWSEVNQSTAHPVKFMHTQLLTTQVDGASVQEAEFVFNRGVKYGEKDIYGIHDMIGSEVVSHPDSGYDFDKLTAEDLNAILTGMESIDISDSDKVTGETWSDLTTMYRTGLRLSDLGLDYGGYGTYEILVEQAPSVVNERAANGRRIDYFIVPTNASSFSVRTPYTGLDSISPYRESGTNGTYYFSLKNGASFNFTPLPAGVSYEVVEYKKDGWKLENSTNTLGTLPDENRTAAFTNRINKGSIKITKETVPDEQGKFLFRGRIWKVEDYAEIVTMLSENDSQTSVNELNEIMLAVNNEVSAETFEFYNAFRMYAAENAVTTSKTAEIRREQPGNVEAVVDGETYIVGYESNLDAEGIGIPANFQERLDQTAGERRVFLVKNGSVIGALTYEYETEARHYLLPENASLVIGETGLFEFYLEKGGEIIFDYIPYGYKYEIWEEKTEGWELVSVSNDAANELKAKGTMLSTGTITHTFTNKKELLDLSIGKEVTGNLGSRDKYFKYEISIENLGARSILHLDMSGATREFDGDQTEYPNDVTAYTKATIVSANNRNDDEQSPLQYQNVNDIVKKACVWTDGTFNYTWDQTGKKWIAESLETGEEIEPEEGPPDSSVRAPEDGQVIIADDQGKARITIYLQHGETAVFRGIPFGASYRVTEENESYEAGAVIADGGDVKTGETRNEDGVTMREGTDISLGSRVNEVADTCIRIDTAITFTNAKEGVIPTEIFFKWWTWLILAGAAGAYMLWRFRRRRFYDG